MTFTEMKFACMIAQYEGDEAGKEAAVTHHQITQTGTRIHINAECIHTRVTAYNRRKLYLL